MGAQHEVDRVALLINGAVQVSTPGGPLTAILGHSFNGDGIAAERVGQQPLQGFHPAVPAGLLRFHDTCLQPSNLRRYTITDV
jgi:hypothetical protein